MRHSAVPPAPYGTGIRPDLLFHLGLLTTDLGGMFIKCRRIMARETSHAHLFAAPCAQQRLLRQIGQRIGFDECKSKCIDERQRIGFDKCK